MKLTLFLASLSLLMTSAAIAQTSSLPDAPKATQPQINDTESMYGLDEAYGNVFGGLAATPGTSAVRATATVGVTLGQYKTGRHGALGAAPQFELGLQGPLPGGYPLDGFVSVNEMFAAKVPRHAAYGNFTAGYTRFFATGDAINFGFGIDFGKDGYSRLIRIEVRDYYLVDGPRQNIVGLRIGFGKLLGD